MKISRTIILTVLIALLNTTVKAQIEHLEPPFWWAGMKYTSLQLMVHGERISDYQVKIDYPGVNLVSIEKADNPNYLFLNLEMDGDVSPGVIKIDFTRDGTTELGYNYELKKREPQSAEREGFNSSDAIYMIMPDRFANGDTSNDEVEGMREGLNRKHKFGRHGGDIKGIIDHLDYLDDMGFTALWLNPVLENDMQRSSYHGYAATDFYRVDRRFGTNEDYLELSRLASRRGIKMIMDMIFNHCGSYHWWMSDLPSDDWLNHTEFVATTHRRTINMDPYASEIDKKGMTDGWFVPSMPDLNQRNPFMAQYLIQNSIWWIEYIGLAGIRMDTYPYPDKHMLAEWNRRVLLEYPDFNITGEEWSTNPVLVSYWQRGQNNMDGYDGGIPSMLDFPLQNAVKEAMIQKEDFNSGLVILYETLANDFLYPDPNNLVIFPDNHDMARFFMQMEKNVDLFRLGIACFLTTRGIPQIFYGTEILMTHPKGNDHGYIRSDFPGGWEGDRVNAFSGERMKKDTLAIQSWFREMLNWRKQASAIHSGQLTHFAPENGVYVYFRYNDEQKVMVILNKNKTKVNLDLQRFREILGGATTAKEVLHGREYNLAGMLSIEPMSPLILEISK